MDECKDYDCVLKAVLGAYQHIPNYYREKFRGCLKLSDQTFVNFIRDKRGWLTKWLESENALTDATKCF